MEKFRPGSEPDFNNAEGGAFESEQVDPEQAEAALRQEIDKLIKEGWKFAGNVFGANQVYKVRLVKGEGENEEEQWFGLSRPYEA